MIASLTGSFVLKTPSYINIDVHGVGYEVQISLNTYSKIQDLKEGTLLTHLQIKEDGHTLFGFAELAEKELFVCVQKQTFDGGQQQVGTGTGFVFKDKS